MSPPHSAWRLIFPLGLTAKEGLFISAYSGICLVYRAVLCQFYFLVRPVGFEPTCLATAVFETALYASSSTGAGALRVAFISSPESLPDLASGPAFTEGRDQT